MSQPELLPALEAMVAEHTAGSPVNEIKRWTNRSPAELANQLRADNHSLLPDVWKQQHPEAVRTYRVEERRDKAERKQLNAARRRLAARNRR